MPDYGSIIDKHAQRTGIDPSWLRKIMRIESGGDTKNTTGSYKGLFQLSEKEFRAHGGSGDIYDPEQNTMAAANKLAKEKLAFQQKYGREAKLTDLYMIHLQGAGGAAAHAANPDAPAWQNMYSTAEGKQKGEAWAKKAIWGNIPDNLKAKFGSVENVKSSDLAAIYGGKLEGTSYEGYGPFKTAKKAEGADEGWKGTQRGTFLGEAPADEGPSKSRAPYEPFDLDVGNIVPSFRMGGMRVPG